MPTMYFRRKQEFDNGRIIGRVYRYGKAKVALFITDEQEKEGFLKYFRQAVKRVISPNKERTYIFSPKDFKSSHPLEQEEDERP